MALLDMQARMATIGRIRHGYSEQVTGRSGRLVMKPVKHDKLIFTSGSKRLVEAAADRYGGDVEPWDNRGLSQWRVFTDVDSVMVSVPKIGDPVDSWYEWWRGGECIHKCDSRTDQKTGKACVCTPDPVQRHLLSKSNPPQACGIKTRISLVLADLPDIGTWRMDTGSFNAAAEMLGKVQIMQHFRDTEDILIPAQLRLDKRSDVKDGQTRRYIVPVLELQATLRTYAAGTLAAGGLAAQLPPAPDGADGPPAITAGGPGAAAEPAGEPLTAQGLADKIVAAGSTGAVTHWAGQAKQLGVADEDVFGTVDDGDDAAQIKMPLRELANLRWEVLHERENAG